MLICPEFVSFLRQRPGLNVTLRIYIAVIIVFTAARINTFTQVIAKHSLLVLLANLFSDGFVLLKRKHQM